VHAAKMRETAHDLVASALASGEVATGVGFADANPFSRVFKAQFSLSRRRDRQANRLEA